MSTGAEREGPDYITHFFVSLGGVINCRMYKLTLSDYALVTLQLTVTLSDLVQRFIAGPPLFDGGGD